MIDIAIATCSSHPNLGMQDRGVVLALADLGIRAAPLVWNDTAANLDGVAAVVIQSTWDSHLDPLAFLAWARGVQARIPLFNPVHLLEWNLNKRYLRALERQGIPVTPTLWGEPGSTVDLRHELKERGWTRIVIKPAVSAGATETYIYDLAMLDTAQATLDRLRAHGEVMVQPYLVAFETEGERSYIFFDGVFSHSVRRPPTLQSAERSFAESHIIDPIHHELRLAQQVLATIDDTPMYARVDVATNNDGIVRLQELELVEPCLFTSLSPDAQTRYAQAIAARLGD
jgi:glutathione synthase/RimK-type ligase-like ATP-grasp enzyme